MKRLAALLCITMLAGTADAAALGELAQVTLIDRDSGAVLPTHYHQGQYWVAGRPGARYAIEVRNRSLGRLLAVMSVDGVNVITGETAGWDQRGYVFDPNDGYRIKGWRKSDEEVAAFTFTESPHSYAERIGRPANVGVIGVALFRERPKRLMENGLRLEPRTESSAEPAKPPSPATQNSAVAQLTPPEGPVQQPQAAPSVPTSGAELARVDPKLGTGHGEREHSHVSHTDFERLHEQPDEIISIHYDSLANLIAMGVIPRPHPPLSEAEPFPGTRGYVPDPPPELP